jgi:hypothetical protein
MQGSGLNSTGKVFSKVAGLQHAGAFATLPTTLFGFARISTFCSMPESVALPSFREAQMDAAGLQRVVVVPTEDLGAGCDIHPPKKRAVGERFADVVHAEAYLHQARPGPPQLASVELGGSGTSVFARVRGVAGALYLRPEVSCATVCKLGTNYTSCLQSCRGPEVRVNGGEWELCDVKVVGRASMELRVSRKLWSFERVSAARYAWAHVPALSVYDNVTQLPVLSWSVVLQ